MSLDDGVAASLFLLDLLLEIVVSSLLLLFFIFALKALGRDVF